MQLAVANFAPTKRYLVGVSGGLDSVVLLHALHARGFGRLVVCHLNHQLRGRAATGDAAFVKKLAASLGYPFEGGKAQVVKLAHDRRQSLETAAREARLAFFAEMARKHRCARIFLAHHADDQAETVLMRILRGTGLSGLRGMAVEQPVTVQRKRLTLLRPLLQVRRSEIARYAAELGLRHREDKSNADTAMTRNRVRHDLIPSLGAAMARDISPMLLRLARTVEREDSLLSELADELMAKALLSDGTLSTKTALSEAHPALQHRVLHRWLSDFPVPDVTQENVEEAVLLLSRREPSRINLARGLQLRRREGRLMIDRQ